MEFTRSMELALDKIKKEAEEFLRTGQRGSWKIMKVKPTKRKVFTAKIINIGIPAFYLSINNRPFGIFTKRTFGWVIDKDKNVRFKG